MTKDVFMLVATALLCLGIPFIYGAGRFMQPGGFAWAAGNRETPLDVPAWTQRAVQAHANLVENLVPFAILVLAAQISGKPTRRPLWGLPFSSWGRVIHLGAYVSGLKYFRTLAWFGAWGGGMLILVQLFH
ncbi:MAG: MAPEG family protein [Tabrizicola sp.]|nr:MAPEG family protein [Tabrizicola sp.]